MADGTTVGATGTGEAEHALAARLAEQRARAILGLHVEHEALPVDPKLRTARSLALQVLAIEVLVLVVSGVYLYFAYRPASSYDPSVLPPAVRLSHDVQRIHRLTAVLAVGTSVVAGILLVAEKGIVGWHRLAEAVSLPLLAGAALITGVLLPWDQLALWSVEVGTDIKGYGFLFGDRVRFVLLGGSEISLGALRSGFAGHLILSVGLGVGIFLGARRLRRTGPDGTPRA
ncbi:hypothetical protein KSP35_02675 [Aquihabitans sp. G128]|uniref:hypothetical protein n=1 Tax=Aquihabitans sp. G128 TaxID=2849779 RepID=UPI001C21CD48|nr:hypothetical protein [Aquihabitans sp. G128]QXC61766.1 hypothetical protein KSP35_02675 [Aquihabitans sp. G128]